MTAFSLDPKTTALVLIDLQHGVVGMNTAPRSGKDVVVNATKLLARFRQLGAPVALVRVAFSAGGADALKPVLDSNPPAPARPANWAELVPEVGPEPADILITKRQWGAFHGTELDLQLRRRGVGSIVLGGISTNIGVESTARAAFELGYQQIFAEDAMAATAADLHDFPLKTIFPRMGRVRQTADILAALPG